MKTRRKKAKKLRLLAAGALLFSLTACEISFDGVDFSGIDLSNLFSDFPAPEPAAPIEYYDISNTPFRDSARFSTAEWTYASLIGSSEMASIAANLASLADDSENITVRLEGHADMRCGEAYWRSRRGGPNPGNSTGTWCSPRDANGVTPQGRIISLDRAKTVRTVLRDLLESYPGAPAKITYDAAGLGEEGARYTAEQCNLAHDPCKRDRRVDVFVSSRTPRRGGGFMYPYPYPGNYPTPEAEIPAPPTCLELGNCPADPKPVADPVGFTSSGFAFAQQNADQLIKFKLGALTCNNGQQTPCGVPSSGEMRTGVSGPHLVSASVSSFNLNAPAGYTQPRDYRITSNPAGSSIGAGVSAKLRFYAATRTGAPYTYSATAAVTIEWHNWQWDGATMTVTSKTTEQLPTTGLVCAPVKTPTCSFGVLGSNVN